MRTKALLFVCYFIMNTLSTPTGTLATCFGAWVDLGSTTVNYVANNAGIEIKAPADNFKKLKITARNSPLVITKLTVTYDKGDSQIIESRFNIAKNGESPMIDLDGSGRNIKRIDFSTDNTGLIKGNAEVTFFVRK